MSANALTTRDNSGNAVTVSSTDVGAGVQAMNHRVCDATAANFLPTMDAAARAGYIIVTNGTQNLPTGDAAARKIFVQACDGTNSTPAGDAAARKIFTTTTDGTNTVTVKAASTLAATTDTSLVVQPLQASDGTHTTPIGDAAARAIQVAMSDGTNAFLSASLANLQAFTGKNAQMVSTPGEQVATANIVTGTTTPAATLSAPGAGKIFVVRWVNITLSATADQVPLLFSLVQDAAGTPLTLATFSLAALAKTTAQVSVPVNIPQTVSNKTLTLSVTTGTIVSTNYITVSFGAVIAA